MFCALVAALGPWALWKLFTAIPPGFNGAVGVAGAAWAAAAVLLALDAIATPLAFMRKCVAAGAERSFHVRLRRVAR